MIIPIKDIQLTDRFREDYGDVTELASSLAQFGQIQPIVLNRDMFLIAGGRRYRAAVSLGWEGIDAIFRDECDELTARELELEENIARKDLTWQERAKLVAEIDRLKRDKYGSRLGGPTPDGDESWDQTDTADSLHMSQSTVSRDLQVARMIELVPELANEPDRASAQRKFERMLELAEREQLVRQTKTTSQTTTELHTIKHGDARELIKQVESGSVSLIFLDLPYGTNLESINPNRYTANFDDTAKSALALFKTLLPELRRVLRADGHLYCFAGIKPTENFDHEDDDVLADYARQLYIPLYAEMVRLLNLAGFEADPIPLVWCKSSFGLTNFDYRYTFAWEPIIYCGSAGRRLAHQRTNVFNVDSVTSVYKLHTAEKPPALYRELIEMSTIEGELVFDPCCGSGNCILAAKQTKRRGLGFELNADLYTGGLLRLADLDRAEEPEICLG